MKRLRINDYVNCGNYGIMQVKEIIKASLDFPNKSFLNEKSEIMFCLNIIASSNKLLEVLNDKDIIEVEISEEFVPKQYSKQIMVIGKDLSKNEIKKDLENGIYKIVKVLTKEQFYKEAFIIKEEQLCKVIQLK